MRAQIVADGVWVSSIGTGSWSDLKYSFTADGGCEAASWTLNEPREFSHSALVPGVVVELKAQSKTFWSGELTEPNFDPSKGWSYQARGLINQGDDCVALGASGAPTSVPDTAIDQGIARGMLTWTRPASISAVPYANTDETDNLNYVTDLLGAFGDSSSKRIRVDADGIIAAYSDPTTPDWYLAPGLAEVGVADEEYYTDLYLRYRSKSTRKYATVHVSDATASAANRREAALDVKDFGLTSSAIVTAFGNGLLAKGQARYAMTQPVNPSRLQLTTPGGKPASLYRVRGGQLVRAFAVRTTQGATLPYYDFVIGRSEYIDQEDTIQIAPVNVADRNLTDVLAFAIKKKAWQIKTAARRAS